MKIPETGLFINPKLSKSDSRILEEQFSLNFFRASKPSYWLASSGSSGVPKLICLSVEALQVSADAVNQHSGLTASDIWLNVLPKFHVGGLSIFFRAQLLESRMIDLDPFKWNAREFTQACDFHKATVTSLVPTQIADLVAQHLKAPSSLRLIFVGGDKLSKELHRAALSLGWKLCPTYGMTEMSSQVATAFGESSSESAQLKILPHIHARSEEGVLWLKSQAACTGFVENGQWTAVGAGQWFQTSDLAEISGGWLSILGRNSDVVKVNGELVSLQKIRSQWIEEKSTIVVAISDLRSGKKIVAVTEDTRSAERILGLIEKWNRSCMPLERMHALYVVNEVPRSPLGKVLFTQLTECLESHKYLQSIATT